MKLKSYYGVVRTNRYAQLFLMIQGNVIENILFERLVEAKRSTTAKLQRGFTLLTRRISK